MTPPGRGPNGQHKPYLRSDGVTVYRVDTGRITPQGTRERLTVSSKDPRKAKAKYQALMRRLRDGDVPQVGSQGMTVGRWAETWLPLHEAEVRPRTFSTDKGTVRKWIVPTIGHRRLADLTPADLRALRDAIVKAGRSSTTAHHSHTILAKMLRDAIREGHSVPDRILKIKKPKKAKSNRAAIPVDQAWSLIAALGKRDDTSRWLLGIVYGMRQGEVLGLDWDHVELDPTRPSVDVEWQLQRLPMKHVLPDGFKARHLIGPMWQTETKTAAGERALPLVGIVAASLAAAKGTWEPNPWGLVWVNPDGLPIRADADRNAWKAIQKEAGVAHPSGRAWHVHECRHTVATLLMRQGTPQAVTEQIIGQSKLVGSYLHADRADSLAALEGVMRQLTAPSDED